MTSLMGSDEVGRVVNYLPVKGIMAVFDLGYGLDKFAGVV